MRFDPLLWCALCAPPLVVKWWIRWERMAAELLQTLPSVPGDADASDDVDDAQAPGDGVLCPGAADDAAAYNPRALP